MGNAPRFCLVIALAGLMVAASGAAWANSYLISPNPNPGQKFPVQGDCAQNGLNPAEPHIDLTRSTWACTGASSQMLRIFYQGGPEECVYIDNFNNDDNEPRAFFIPLQSSEEWLAFAANLPGGVHLRYGCPGEILSDTCGNEFVLPDAEASDDPKSVIHIVSGTGDHIDFSCPLTAQDGKSLAKTGGCGAWVKVKETGNCDPAVSTGGGKAANTGTQGTNSNSNNTNNGPTTTILPTTPPDNPGGPLIPMNP